MTHQWKVGDLARCIKRGEWAHESGAVKTSCYKDPKYGEILRVSGVGLSEFWETPILLFDGFNPNGYARIRFEPLVDAREDDTALIARIRACKPARQEVG